MEAAAYRARRPAQTPLYALLESFYEAVKGAWEDLIERRFGFWRGVLDGVVARYLDCRILERGFARVRCPDCAAEYLLAFSCKGRGRRRDSTFLSRHGETMGTFGPSRSELRGSAPRSARPR